MRGLRTLERPEPLTPTLSLWEREHTERAERVSPNMLQSDSANARRRSIGFLNWAHALDHYVMLIYPTVVIGLALVEGRGYAELIALGTGSFVAFGVFSLPAGLALALGALGMFAAIYHPVGTAMVLEAAERRGRSVAFNGVCGNLGAALAAGMTAALIEWVGWRGAFLVPAAVLLATGAIYPCLVPDDRTHAGGRSLSPDVPLKASRAAVLFGLFMVVALAAGLVFNTISVALPKIVDERLGSDIPLLAVGGLATAVFMCGALAQLAVGRLVERYPPHLLFAVIALMQFGGLVWVAFAKGAMLLAALALTMGAIYAQVTVNDLVIARYTADAWRGRVYAVRYFLTFLVSGVAVSAIAFLYARGGFDLVLSATAWVALGFVGACVAIAILVKAVERARVIAPAE